MKASEIAEHAAELVSERGHTKGVLWDDADRVCIMGAIMISLAELEGYSSPTESPNRFELAPVLSDVTEMSGRLLGKRRGQGWMSSVDWNNEPERTGEEVILHLKRTAEALREDGR